MSASTDVSLGPATTTGTATVNTSPSEFLTFQLGDEEYGIDIQTVQELRGYQAVTAIAQAAEFIKGVLDLRGVIVPIVDLRIKFRHPSPRYDQFTVVIILDIDTRVVGIVVDHVSDVVTLQPGQIKPPPDMGAHAATQYVMGIGTLEQRMLILTDVKKLLSEAEVRLIEQAAA